MQMVEIPGGSRVCSFCFRKTASRYGTRKGLLGIEVLNEPITDKAWKLMDVPNRYPAVDQDMAEGSGQNTMEFLKDFYCRAYDRIRKYMPEEKYVNVVLDTHQYLMMAEADGCQQNLASYLNYIQENYEKNIEEMQKYFPVICGEWCLFNSLACCCDLIRRQEQYGSTLRIC